MDGGHGSPADTHRRWTWYLARLRAMPPREVAWRAGTTVAQRVRPFRGAAIDPPTWGGSWPVRLQSIVESRRIGLLADAERIAAGELSLWGRRVDVEPHRVQWDVAPFGQLADQKPRWELNRQQHLFVLAAGAALADREDWARICCAQLLGWIDAHPRPTWDSAYETAHRLVGWAWTIPLVRDALSEAELARISRAYVDQAAFVAARPSRYSSANNHRLAELTGLLAADVAGVRVDWQTAWSELENCVDEQTFVDGGSREQAGGYFLYVLEILWVAVVFARATGRSLGTLEGRLRAMVQWLSHVAGPDLEPPPLGDDAEDRMLRPEYFEPRRAAAIAGRAQALLDGALTLEPAPLGPARQSVVLPESGFAVFRGGTARVVTDVGDLGFGSLAAHGHADALSIVGTLGDRAFVRDSGTCAYAPAELREPYRATAAHNTVVVDGRSQAVARGPHLWGRRFKTTVEAQALAADVDYVRASHDGYAPAVHTRSVSFLKPDLILVLDRVTSPDDCTATLIWQRPGEPVPLGLSIVSSPSAHQSEGDGPFSPRYTWCMEAPRSTWTSRGREIVFASVLALARDPVSVTADHQLGETVVEVGGRRLIERWHGPGIEEQR